MTQPSKSKGAAASAQPAQGVATEAARSPEAGADVATGATTEEPTTDLKHCADCGSEEIVYVTEDPAAESKAYCKRDLPANITPKMVEEQGRT